MSKSRILHSDIDRPYDRDAKRLAAWVGLIMLSCLLLACVASSFGIALH